MDNDKTEPVNEPTPVAPAPAIPELAAARQYFLERGWRWALLVVLALVVMGGYLMFRANQRAQIDRASAMLMSASSLTTLQDIVKQYPTAPAAPIALLLLARSHYDSGQFALADGAYADFQMRYPDHLMAGAAQLGRFHCLEGMGQVENALDGYAEFIRTRPGHYLLPMAQLGKARALSILGRYGEARIEYENFMAANPDSVWAREAEQALSLLDRSIPTEAAEPAPAAAPDAS